MIEVGSFPSAGYGLGGKLVPATEVKMRHMLRRLRLGGKDANSDHWFNFDGGDYAGVASSVVPYIRGQAVEWWSHAES